MMEFIKEKKDQLLTKVLRSNEVLGAINTHVQRYGVVKDISKDKNGFHADVEIAGLSETISVCIKEIILAEDQNSVTLKDITCNIQGLHNVFADYLEGKSFDIPDSKHKKMILGILAKFL